MPDVLVPEDASGILWDGKKLPLGVRITGIPADYYITQKELIDNWRTRAFVSHVLRNKRQRRYHNTGRGIYMLHIFDHEKQKDLYFKSMRLCKEAIGPGIESAVEFSRLYLRRYEYKGYSYMGSVSSASFSAELGL